MGKHPLDGRHILVVEDEYFIAADITDSLRAAGAKVLGPVPSVDDAANMIQSETGIDAAVLDINLRGDMVFPIADALLERGIPFAFATGYDEWMVPPRFSDAPRLQKPLKGDHIAAVLGSLVSHLA